MPSRTEPLSQANPIEPILPPTYELNESQTAIETFDPPGAGSKLRLQIATHARNPNGFAIRIKQINYDIYLNGKKFTGQSLALDQFILANASIPLNFLLHLSLENQLELMTAVAKAFTGLPLTFKIVGETVFTSQSYEFKSRFVTLVEGSTLARESIVVPELKLEASLSSVLLLREDAPVVRVVISATNTGDVGYFLYGKDIALRLSGEVLALQDLSPVPIPAGQDSRFELLFYPSLKDISEQGRLVLEAALATTPTAIALEGTLFIDVLGVDSFELANSWDLSGFLYE